MSRHKFLKSKSFLNDSLDDHHEYEDELGLSPSPDTAMQYLHPDSRQRIEAQARNGGTASVPVARSPLASEGGPAFHSFEKLEELRAALDRERERVGLPFFGQDQLMSLLAAASGDVAVAVTLARDSAGMHSSVMERARAVGSSGGVVTIGGAPKSKDGSVRSLSALSASLEEAAEAASAEAGAAAEGASTGGQARVVLQRPGRATTALAPAIAEAQAARADATHSTYSLITIGHVDAGKSTLSGQLLFSTSSRSDRERHRLARDAESSGKGSFALAWAMDASEEERARGITVDVGSAQLVTPHRHIVLLDAPGHRDFIPNMITGAAQADVAMLVVEATTGEFEGGFRDAGQTKEHVLLARGLGVTQLVVAVNKMDTVGWEQARFDDIKGQLMAFLRRSGYRASAVTVVPVSGLTGENVVTEVGADHPLRTWYTGPTLLQVIDSMDPTEVAASTAEAPFRMAISDVYRSQALGFAVSGKVETGVLASGDVLSVVPLGQNATARSVTVVGGSAVALPGDTVDVALHGVEAQYVHTGDWLCDPAAPVRVYRRFRAQILTFPPMKIPLHPGFQGEVHLHQSVVPGHVRKLIHTIDKATGGPAKRKPRVIGEGVSALVEFDLSTPIPATVFADFRPLGRFTFRQAGRSVAAGVIVELIK